MTAASVSNICLMSSNDFGGDESSSLPVARMKLSAMYVCARFVSLVAYARDHSLLESTLTLLSFIPPQSKPGNSSIIALDCKMLGDSTKTEFKANADDWLN